MPPNDICPDCGRQSSKFDPSMDDTEWKFCHAWTCDSDLMLECQRKAVARLRGDADYRRKLRDSAAVSALQGILSDGGNAGIEHRDPQAQADAAKYARQYAHALMVGLGYDEGTVSGG
jgi:hypothetical protein